MPGLLVSVRSVAEAQAAVAGGAALIDVKEPSRGPLGRADAQVVADVIRCTAGVRPVSAALGELLEEPEPLATEGLGYAKWGLAGCAGRADWREPVRAAASRLRRALPGCTPVIVAYADHRRAGAPPPDAVMGLACELPGTALLVDTWGKGGTTLLDWLSMAEVCRLCASCREYRIPVALAGSLQAAQIEALLPAAPDWFAVRGAACQAGCRKGPIDPVRVRRLVDFLSGRQRMRGG